MRIITAAELEQVLDPESLIDRLRDYFRDDITVPVRHHHTIPIDNGTDATLLLMPAWRGAGRDGGYIGIKVASVFPDNGTRNLPAVMASYLLLNAETGLPVAMLDGAELTARRTAAASALAASYLARTDSERLLMIGTGKLAPYLIRAHAAVRPIHNVLIWGRDFDKARRLAKSLNRDDFSVSATHDLETAARGAHIISAATLATTPLIKGAWLNAGQHVDLVGGFTPTMREADDDAVRRARLFVDTRAGALKEAGDIVDPMARGVISQDNVQADLFELCRGERAGRNRQDEITLFKSVGTALEDLAAAKLAYERT